LFARKKEGKCSLLHPTMLMSPVWHEKYQLPCFYKQTRSTRNQNQITHKKAWDNKGILGILCEEFHDLCVCDMLDVFVTEYMRVCGMKLEKTCTSLCKPNLRWIFLCRKIFSGNFQFSTYSGKREGGTYIHEQGDAEKQWMWKTMAVYLYSISSYLVPNVASGLVG
jgi:hypothetical protein